MSGFFIDVSALQALRHALGATESQMVAAFNKALRQTVNQLYKASVTTMLKTTGAKNRKMVQGRMRRAVNKVGSAGEKAGTGRVWMGLDDMPVSTLRGRAKAARGIRPQDRKRDVRGRFLPEKGGHDATFTPAAAALRATTFPDSFLATVKGKRSIWVRHGSGHINEARIAVRESMNDAIENNIYSGALDMLMANFEKDLAGRVRGNVNLNSKGNRI